jgi:hypothetical protein
LNLSFAAAEVSRELVGFGAVERDGGQAITDSVDDAVWEV